MTNSLNNNQCQNKEVSYDGILNNVDNIATTVEVEDTSPMTEEIMISLEALAAMRLGQEAMRIIHERQAVVDHEAAQPQEQQNEPQQQQGESWVQKTQKSFSESCIIL